MMPDDLAEGPSEAAGSTQKKRTTRKSKAPASPAREPERASERTSVLEDPIGRPWALLWGLQQMRMAVVHGVVQSTRKGTKLMGLVEQRLMQDAQASHPEFMALRSQILEEVRSLAKEVEESLDSPFPGL